jgi:hypothetical protein
MRSAYEAAVETLRRDETYRTSSRRFLAASLAPLGRLDEARAEVELFLVGNPHFTTRWATTEPFGDAATLEHFVDGLPQGRSSGVTRRRDLPNGHSIRKLPVARPGDAARRHEGAAADHGQIPAPMPVVS